MKFYHHNRFSDEQRDFIRPSSEISPFEMTLTKEQLADLFDIIDKNEAELTDIEQYILKHRILTPDITLDTIGKKLRFTRERIRQLQNQVIIKLGEAMELRGWDIGSG